MITEDYVSFETAKLLKEKGFDEECNKVIHQDTKNEYYFGNYTDDIKGRLLLVPTFQMAMKWLREKYNIYISIQPDFPSDKDYKNCWCWSASILHENCISTKGSQCYIETYEEATEAAIEYCLEYLI